MSRGWQALRRVAFAVFAAYLVLSVVFAFIAFTPDPHLGQLTHAAAIQSSQADIPVEQTGAWQQVVEYKQRRHLNEPVSERYIHWLVDVTTLDWGQSFGANPSAGAYGQPYPEDRPVTALVAGALSRTLWYVLPAVAFSVVGGIAVGAYAATHQHTLVDRLGTSVAHLGFSFPNFWLAEMVVVVVVGGGWLVGIPDESSRILRTVGFPAAILGTSLFAGQVRYARAESLEYIDTEFIKLVRAKGAPTARVARHLLRNAAVPLVSLFFTDMIGIVVLNVFIIEYVFGIPGLGGLSLVAIQSRDLPVILGASMVVVLLGIAGNLAQDIAYLVLDPRVE